MVLYKKYALTALNTMACAHAFVPKLGLRVTIVLSPLAYKPNIKILVLQ